MSQLARKETTEGFLRSRGVRVNPHLPFTESPEELSLATPQQVARRACIISGLISRAFGAPRDLVLRYFESGGLLEHATASEIALIRAPSLEQKQVERLKIQVEGLWELAWVLCLIPSIDHFQYCGHQLITLVPKLDEPVSGFVERAQMRPLEDLLAEADMLYRLHWAVREASLRQQSIPNGLRFYVTDERLRAINWVLLSDVSWEDTDTST
jgi:hypothetical protein